MTTTPAVDTLSRPLATPAEAVTAPTRRWLTVECIDSEWGFSALRPQWNELLRASAANGPFLTWEWLHTWWRHLHAGGSLRLVVVRAGHELVAVAPLTLRPRQFGVFNRLDFLGTGHAGSDYLDLIVRHGHDAGRRCGSIVLPPVPPAPGWLRASPPGGGPR
jgi:CelD/BcsL family acetyltransferase involved in cellulose biosynthesis